MSLALRCQVLTPGPKATRTVRSPAQQATIAVTDAKKGATIGDLVNQVGQNKIAINFV